MLIPDRYSYRYDDGERIDPPAGESSVVLETSVDGRVPTVRVPEIACRVGVDLHPLNAGDRDIEWLETLIWPEHTDRVARLHKAAQLVADVHPRSCRATSWTRCPRWSRARPQTPRSS